MIFVWYADKLISGDMLIGPCENVARERVGVVKEMFSCVIWMSASDFRRDTTSLLGLYLISLLLY